MTILFMCRDGLRFVAFEREEVLLSKNKFDFISQTQKFFCPTRAEQVFVNTSERNVRVCVYMRI